MAIQIPTALRDEVSGRLGIDDRVSGELALVGAVSRCMAAAGIGDAGEYCAKVLRNRQLFDALIDELVVPESWFFRDGTPFEWLAEWAVAWCRNNRGGLLRILSAPCAGGQEPYSVVITLLEAGLTADAFAVEAGDVSERSLQQARAGVFKSYAFRGQRMDLRERYFVADGSGCYAVAEAVRSKVRFRRLNLLQELPPPDGQKYQIILCRNVLIYLTANARQRVYRWLDASLTDDGILFAGHADDMSGMSDRLESVGRAGAFCFQRRRVTVKPPMVALEPVQRSRKEKRIARRPLGTATGPAPLPPAPVPRGIAAARGLADAGQLEEASELCRAAINSGDADEEMYVLHATILGALGSPVEAERALRGALYLNPHNGEALLQLALLAERRGNLAEAARLRRRLGR